MWKFFIALLLIIAGMLLWFFASNVGYSISSNAEDFAHFGSYFGGIFGPITTGFGLFYVGLQWEAQVKRAKLLQTYREAEKASALCKNTYEALMKEMEETVSAGNVSGEKKSVKSHLIALANKVTLREPTENELKEAQKKFTYIRENKGSNSFKIRDEIFKGHPGIWIKWHYLSLHLTDLKSLDRLEYRNVVLKMAADLGVWPLMFIEEMIFHEMGDEWGFFPHSHRFGEIMRY